MKKITLTVAQKICEEMVDFFCKLVEFERRDDIVVKVIDTPTSISEDTRVKIDHKYKYFTLLVNIYPAATYDELTRDISHELAHVFTAELFIFTDKYMKTEKDDDMFVHVFERVADRLEILFQYVWRAYVSAKEETDGSNKITEPS